MSQVSVSGILDCSFDKLKSAIMDCDHHHEHFEFMESSKVLTKKGKVIEAIFTLNLLTKFNYTLRIADEGDTISWTLVDGDLFTKNSGSWKLEPQPKNKVKATYTLDVEFKIKIPQVVKEKLVEHDLKKILPRFEAWAKSI